MIGIANVYTLCQTEGMTKNDMASDAAALIALSNKAEAARYVQPLTREVMDRAFDLDDKLNAARKSFRRQHFPRRHHIVTVAGNILAVSKTGKATLLWKEAK